MFRKLFLVAGVGFHIFLAVPFPPSSYYPFSMVSLAVYAGCLFPRGIRVKTEYSVAGAESDLEKKFVRIFHLLDATMSNPFYVYFVLPI